MKKLAFLAALSIFISAHAQQQPQQRTCGTPVLPQQYEEWVTKITPVPGKYGNAQVQSVFNIPVIVHIIHNNEAVNSAFATNGNNLNAAQVIDQINILNRDFNGTNADTSLIPAVFKPLLGKFQVNFCLAVVNPTGGVLAEPGIDRINRVAKGWNNLPYSQTYMNSTVKPNSIWNPNQYFNIWVAPLSGGLLGYATFPNPGTSGLSGLTGSFGTATSDGIVVLNTSFGSIGTAQSGVYNKGRTATHEVGHWIGLRHIWGDSNCGNDFCNDTPPAQSSNFGCPNFPYKLGTCTGNTTGEMTMNFMDYTNDACMYMFTQDQKYRAQLILTNSPIRAALLTSTVCNLPTVGNDVGITFVAQPAYSQSINCVDNINPVIHVTNFGSTSLTSVTFSYDVDGVNTQTLSWTGSVAPGSSFTLTIPQISGLSFGMHHFNVQASAPNGGNDNNLNNNSNQQPFLIANNFSFNAPSGTICAGNPIVLTASGATSYSWSTGANTASVSLNPPATSNYTVTGFLGLCSVPRTVTVTVKEAPTLVLNKTSVCEGAPTTITASGANSYSWNTGQTSASIQVTLSAPTNFTVTGNAGPGCTSVQSFTVNIDSLPSLALIATNLSCGSCNDATITAQVTGGTAPYSYNWTPGNITTASASDLEPGCYQLTVTDIKGCKVVDSACVSFDTGIHDRFSSLNTITVVPNPGSGKYTITVKEAGDKTIQVMNALGQVLLSDKSNSTTIDIDITSYSVGIYYIRLDTQTGNKILRIIKKE